MLWPLSEARVILLTVEWLHVDVDAAPQREVDGAGRNEGVRVAVIERKTRGLRQVGEGVERERRGGRYRAGADVAALQAARRLLAERLDVEAVLD